MRKKNIGIVDIETYFPKLYVSQEELESHMKVSKGKFTKGLLQTNMSVADCSEDIVSMSLTAMHNLMRESNIKWEDIGRLSVGTESSIDKSKSIKTYMLDIFQKHGNNDILGVDMINACYGGTAALLDSVNWIESTRWDGRYAIVITGDIATYEKGIARPTGGAGVTAMLIGPDAPIVLGQTLSSHFENVYDFYKPNMVSEYPVVDGKLSNECYIRALDNCYHLFCCKDGRSITQFDYSIFHAPYGKLVKKSFERLLDKEENINIDIDKEELFETKIKPTLTLSNECGNMYTGSIYASLYSLITSTEKLNGKNALVFSYGSGLAATMFELSFTNEIEKFQKWKNTNLKKKLEERIKLTPAQFEDKLDKRENKYILNNKNLTHHSPIVYDNTYVLKSYDTLHRRTYGKPLLEKPLLEKVSTKNSTFNLNKQNSHLFANKRGLITLAKRLIRR